MPNILSAIRHFKVMSVCILPNLLLHRWTRQNSLHFLHSRVKRLHKDLHLFECMNVILARYLPYSIAELALQNPLQCLQLLGRHFPCSLEFVQQLNGTRYVWKKEHMQNWGQDRGCGAWTVICIIQSEVVVFG